jgi:hypothetical protein
MLNRLRDVFASLSAHEIKYVVIGGTAAIPPCGRRVSERRLEMKVEGQRFWVASRDDLIRSKRAAGRPIDLEDVRLLEAGEAGLA